MKGIITSAVKKVTLELIYQVVDERTKELATKIEELKKKQEEDFRYLVQKIDSNNQRIDTVIQMLMELKK
ncbi:MAG: hypothetical protein FJ266_08045 [Planctomycetes bacterium]|nr:hypothetical protein [Planctomycetota bacterium]